MSRHGFELLPPSTAARVARLRASRRATWAALSMTALAAAVALGGAWLDRRSSAMLEKAQSSGAPVVAIEEEIARLRADERAIAAQLDLQRAIGVSIPASDLIQSVATSLPQGATLEHLSLVYENVQGTNRKLRRGTREETLPRTLRGELRGIAADEAGVGRIIDALGALTPLEEISLESSRSRDFHGRGVREFRIGFRVDLEKRWRLPALAEVAPRGAEEAAP